MATEDFAPPVGETLHSPLLERKEIALTLLRLDTIHPVISGNKWFKLKENIRSAKAAGKQQLLSFGGAHSNHLAALAAAAAGFGMTSIGLVRGWHGRDKPTPTLEKCLQDGMRLYFLSREDYARKAEPEFLRELAARYPLAWIIPEGGNNAEGRTGASEIAAYVPAEADYLVLPVGTGTTLAGIRLALPAHQQVLGMAPFKRTDELEKQIQGMLDRGSVAMRHSAQAVSIKVCKTPQTRLRATQQRDDAAYKMLGPTLTFRLCNDYHFGGFAKSQPELIDFMNGFYQTHGIPLDFIYTGKMLYGLMDLIEKDYFPPGSRLCPIHTGGLQGNQSRKDLVY